MVRADPDDRAYDSPVSRAKLIWILVIVGVTLALALGALAFQFANTPHREF
jgi:hypothetical protein